LALEPLLLRLELRVGVDKLHTALKRLRLFGQLLHDLRVLPQRADIAVIAPVAKRTLDRSKNAVALDRSDKIQNLTPQGRELLRSSSRDNRLAVPQEMPLKPHCFRIRPGFAHRDVVNRELPV